MSNRNKNLSEAELSRINYEKSLQASKGLEHHEESFLTTEEIVKEDDLPETQYAPSELPESTFTAKLEDKPSDEFDSKKLMEELSPSGQIVLQSILEYIDDMYPGKPMPENIGRKHQFKLFSALKTLFNNLEDKDFIPLYKGVLRLFEIYKDSVFSETYVYRFAESWEMGETDRAFFRRILNLILVTREVKTRRQVFKQLRLPYTLEFGLTDRAKNRIMNFYQ